MTDISRDALGDRMKAYEGAESNRSLPKEMPVVARIDGRSFSKFTRRFNRPFDSALHGAMVEATAGLLKGTHADIGYTQSDEITLIWSRLHLFDGRVSKMTSILAAMATAHFCVALARTHADAVSSGMPHFDARVWTVPTKEEAANALLWRSQDARKNGVSSAARANMSAKQMHGLDQAAMKMRMQEVGTDYDLAYPRAHRFGTYLQRRLHEKRIPDDMWERIPLSQRPENRSVMRSQIDALDIEYFGDITNRTGVIFDKETPLRRDT